MRFPSLCKHKRTGRAFATDPATGKQVWFGMHGTAEAQHAYDCWIAALAARRADVPSGTLPGTRISLARLAADYTAFAKKYYVKRGKPTSEVKLLRHTIGQMLSLFPALDASAFGPMQLKAVRQSYIAAGWNLHSINQQCSKLVRMFRWAVENELARPDQLVALRAVKALSPGRCDALVPPPILPVDPAHVRAAAAHTRPMIGAMLLTHLATGMRTGELVEMSLERIDLTREPWLYVPEHHKSEHRGKDRIIYLGPQAREVLGPWIEKARWRGVGWIWLGQRGPISTAAYCRCVKNASKRAGVPRFRPLQIRHTAATAFRIAAGIEGAQALLGHANLSTTEIYAEQRSDLAKLTIEKIG